MIPVVFIGCSIDYAEDLSNMTYRHTWNSSGR